jgi:hypothetical protein
VARLGEAIGLPVMPWQAQVLNVAFELDPESMRPVYRSVRVAVPRQSGKTTLLLMVQMDRCLNWGDLQHTIYTAQDRNHAREKWEEQTALLARTRMAPQFQVRKSNGSERTTWLRTGSTVSITASGETSGHGATIDLALIDEAWAQRDERLTTALRPAMMTRRTAQEWWLSTMGTQDSIPWDDRVDDGRLRAEAQAEDVSARSGVAYFEWSAGDQADPYDEREWWGCMPALGRTVDLDTIRTDAESLPEAEFRRSYLNQRVLGGQPVFEAGMWSALKADARVSVPLCFGADVTPDRSFSSVVAASQLADGKVAVELVDHKEGAGWLVQRLAELTKRWDPTAVVVDKVGPAGRMAADLTGLEVPVRVLDTGQYAGACGAMFDAIVDGTVVHRGQLPLDAAVAAARKRTVGDTWVWARRAGADMSPMVAATLARWATLADVGELTPQVW